MLTALDLAGIPLHARDRDDDHPLVIAGGHAAFNPEPIADFIDAAVLGDGEQAVLAITEVVRGLEGARAGPGGRERAAAAAGAAPAASTCPRFYDVDYLPDGRIKRVVPNRPGVPVAGQPSTPSWTSTSGRTRSSRWSRSPRPCTSGCQRRDLPRLHARLPVLPGRHDHPPGARALDHRHRRDGRERPGRRPASRRSACSRCPAPTTPRSPRSPRASPTATRAPRPRCRCRRTRVDAFNIDLANELTRNGRRSGLTFAPEGGSERIRKVINKMVTEEDLIRTVTAAYAAGWRQVKLYFMCGLPTETDEDVLQIADLAQEGHRDRPRGRPARRDIRCTVSIGGFVPKPHTPVPVGGAARPRDDRRAAAPSCATRSASDRQYGKAIGFRYHDGKPGIVEGLLSRGDRRVGAVIRGGLARTAAGSTAGASTSPSTAGWPPPTRALADEPVDVDWYTTRERESTRCCPGTTSTPASTGLALGGLAGRAGRGRGRGLPLDAVLRLRRLPADGHRDPGRARPARRCCR